MKKQIKNWALRLAVTGLFLVGLLLVIILNPILTYANKTVYKNYTVFHNKRLESTLKIRLVQATEYLQVSELYNHKLKLEICLNDGSKYPKLMRTLRGRAFAWGFYDKVILQGSANYNADYVELNGYRWNLTQLLAHELTHCMQFDKFGFWNSNPIANIPNWKWEGYAEYVARQNNDQKDLIKNITRLIESSKDSWEIKFEDGTIAPREYYNYWTLVQYCMEIKNMNYKKVLEDTTSEEAIRQDMMHWYSSEALSLTPGIRVGKRITKKY